MEDSKNLEDWQAQKFREFYDEEYTFLQRRLEAGKTDREELQGVLENLYIFDGNNLDGRSLVMQLSISATIAAYEAVIAKLEKNS